MRKEFNLSLLFLAMLFIVLHNVTPHTHEHSVSMHHTSIIDSPESGLLGSGLLIDLGGDHLSAFSKCQNDFSGFDVTNNDGHQISPLISWLEYSLDITVSTSPVPIYLSDCQEDIYLSARVSRGPPSMS